VLVLFWVLPALAGDSLIKEGERQRAPDFALPDSQGATAQMADFEGKVVLVNFWATWCVPCKEEIPWFIEFERTFKDQGFAVIGISLDEKGFDVARPYMQKMGMNYRVLMGDARTAYKYGNVDSLPVTFLIDKQRRVAAIHFGLVSKKKIAAEIRKLLE
jgi:cytochrome c biogenesis protein CcmG/thiol:disulfide interchange protein DsbE